MIENTYWNHKGLYSVRAEKLQALLPASGSVEAPRKNPKLEKYRKAVNCYYDLYNNGLCNRIQEFRHVFGFAAGNYRTIRYNMTFDEFLYERTEERMDEIILDAAREQGIWV